MKDILRAVGTFLIALLIGVGVEKILVLAYDIDLQKAAAVGMAVVIGVGFYLCQLGRKTPPQR